MSELDNSSTIRMPPRFLRNLIRFPLGVYLAIVLCGVLVGGSWFSYTGQLDFTQWNAVLFLIALLLGIACCWVVSRARSASLFAVLERKNHYLRTTAAFAVLLFLLELVIVRGCGFATGWDAGTITNFEELNANYYSTYPNQLFLAGVFQRINQLAAAFGIQDGYTCCVIFGCLHVSASVFLIAQVARQVGGLKAGCCCFAASFVFLGLSPWILVPYSDTYAVFWTTFILFCYVCIKNKPIKVFCILLGSVIGYSIKPTVVFVLVAIVLVELVCQINLRRRKNANETQIAAKPCASESKKQSLLLSVFSAFLALGLGFFLVFEVKDIGVSIDDSKALSFTHYLMMGFNPETKGAYSESDVLFSLDQPEQKRQNVNIKVWEERISQMGKRGLIYFFATKSLSNYADGTFSWEGEGHFYSSISGDSDILKSLYGIGYGQENLFAPIAQTIWLFVLFGLILACFLCNKASKYECVAMLSILMLSCFLLLFECRARYLFLFIPFYTLLCVLGWRELSWRIKSRFPRFMNGIQN